MPVRPALVALNDLHLLARHAREVGSTLTRAATTEDDWPAAAAEEAAARGEEGDDEALPPALRDLSAWLATRTEELAKALVFGLGHTLRALVHLVVAEGQTSGGEGGLCTEEADAALVRATSSPAHLRFIAGLLGER